jgi:acyl carrier protein
VDPERITPELKLNDLKAWDSLGHMSLMMQLEQKLGVEVNEESIIQCTSVAGILELLSRKDA